MITRDQVVEMANTAGFDIQEADEWIAEAQVVDSGNLWITERIERLVHAAYKRGVEDSARICTDTATEHIDIYGSAYLVGTAQDILKLLEDTCTTS